MFLWLPAPCHQCARGRLGCARGRLGCAGGRLGCARGWLGCAGPPPPICLSLFGLKCLTMMSLWCET